MPIKVKVRSVPNKVVSPSRFRLIRLKEDSETEGQTSEGGDFSKESGFSSRRTEAGRKYFPGRQPACCKRDSRGERALEDTVLGI